MERLSENWKDDYQYCVRFWTRDEAEGGKEEYYYWPKDKEMAERHFQMFKDTRDDPDYPKMYRKIEFGVVCGEISHVVDKILF